VSKLRIVNREVFENRIVKCLKVKSSFDCCLKEFEEDVDWEFVERKIHPDPVIRWDPKKFLVVLDQV